MVSSAAGFHFEAPADGSPANPTRLFTRWTAAAPDRGRLLCAACAHPITSADQATERAGAHAHQFANPLGQRFHIGCFQRAPGCRETGPAHPEHSWFADHVWRIALCGRCGGQIGWGFRQARADHFFGLILSRLEPTA